MSKNSYSRVGGENVRLLQALIDEAPSYTKPTNSRNANILKSIINNTEYNEPPQSEIEELLIALKAKIGGEIEVNELTVTENGSYDAGLNKAYNPVNVELPFDSKEITANGTYNASEDNLAGFSQVTVNVEGYKLKDIPNTPTAIATFSDGSNLPMPKLQVGIEPQQDLHGYDAPWVGGAGKNLLEVTATTETVHGVTFTVNADGTILTSGTATAKINFKCGEITSKGLAYSGNGCPSDGQIDATFGLFFDYMGADSGNGINNVAVASGNLISARILIENGADMNGKVFKPMIRLASVTDATFEPYSNICPISGWSAVDVNKSGKNLIPYVELGTLNQTDGSEEDNSDNKRTGFIRTLPNTQYTISGLDGSGISIRIFEFKEDKSYIRNYVSSNITNSVTIQTGAKVGYIRYQGNKNIITTNVAQCEKGTTATTYEPYNGSTITIQLGDTYYGCKLDVVSGVLTVDWVLKTLVGTETWFYSSTYNRVYTYISDAKKPSGANNYSILSDKLHFSGGVNEDYGAHINNAGNLIVFAPSSITSDDQWKTWLAANNVQVVYELATPTTIQLPTTVVKSLRGVNNISADSGDVLDGKYFAEL